MFRKFSKQFESLIDGLNVCTLDERFLTRFFEFDNDKVVAAIRF